MGVRGGEQGTPAATSFRWRLAGLIAVGTVVRLILAVVTHGHPYDMHSYSVVRHDLAAFGLHVYGHVNEGQLHWPYGPVFFPWVALSGDIAGASLTAFRALIRLPAIAADAALAWLVQDYLRARGATERARLLGAGSVALGPVFVGISGFHGQIDSLAILPAAIGVVAWERMEGEQRSLVAGALIGLGGAIKTVPLLAVLAVAPTARSWRELAGLAVSAAAVPLLLIAPFFLATPHPVETVLRGYQGFPGQGGLSLALQPDLALTWLMGPKAHPAHYSNLTGHLVRHSSHLVEAVLVVVALFLARYRPRPVIAACVLWLAMLAFAPGFFFQYLIWGLPFFAMAGWAWPAIALQVASLGPMVLYYLEPWHAKWPAYVYIAIQLVVWAAMLGALVLLVREVMSRRPPPTPLLPRRAPVTGPA